MNRGGDRSNLADGDSNLERGETRIEGGETNASEHSELEESPSENQLNLEEGKKPNNEKNVEETKHEDKVDVQTEEKIEENQDKDSDVSSDENKMEDQAKDHSEILNETNIQNGPWSTQVAESENEKQLQKNVLSKDQNERKWKICNIIVGPDYIPCLDNIQAIRKLPSTMHYEHRERHCPDEAPTCLVALPEGYKRPIKWPKSREQVDIIYAHYTEKLLQLKF
ncbi:hypothetical protein HYC85_004489 [Camellia sinensis]|uniref:Methyltransferase n=1 Tax=Camellia sinensis TaxID=4442 RepID=A0A7J7HYS6_CAMSI|nr:hypothetical protein HYC85_004489 [Camellia sinensis]